jgi:hypothetical protein
LALASPTFIFLSLPTSILCHSDFIKSLTTGRKIFKKFKKIVKKVYGHKALKRTWPIPLPKWRITSKSIRKLTQAHDMPTETVHTTLHNFLKLSKKSATWVSKLLYEKMKKE